MNVRDKVILVTGAAGGMGRELVLNLLARGARVAAADVNEKGLQETAELAGSRGDCLSIHVVNITSREEVQALPEPVITRHGAIDGVINNAGVIQPFVRINDLEFAAIDRVMQINFFGAVNVTKAFLPHLLERPEAHIVNISSMGGFLPVPGQVIYGASKAAIKLFTEGLYSEMLGTGVKVTVVFPGAMNTNIAANSGVAVSAAAENAGAQKQFKTLEPAKAARIILDGVEKNRFQIYVGSDSKYMNLLYRMNPGFATRFIFKQMRSLLGG